MNSPSGEHPPKAEAAPKKKSKKRFLKFLLLIPLLLICGVLTLSYMKSHGQPYSQEIDEALILSLIHI